MYALPLFCVVAIKWKSSRVVLCCFESMAISAYLMRGHVAIITKTKSTYVMESTLRFDDVEDISGLLLLLRTVQRSRMQSRERSGRRGYTCVTDSVVPRPMHRITEKGLLLLGNMHNGYSDVFTFDAAGNCGDG